MLYRIFVQSNIIKDITKISNINILKEIGELESSIYDYVWNDDEDLR